MANRKNVGNAAGGDDTAERLTQIGDRTNLMIIDATLRALPQGERGFADAAADVGVLARRMLQATLDYQASLKASSDT